MKAPATSSESGGGEGDVETGSDAGPLRGHFAIVDARLPGGAHVVVEVDRGIIRAIVRAIDEAPPDGLPIFDAEGATLVPGFVDSHVHLAYRFGDDDVAGGQSALRAKGIVAAVDLAAPMPTMAAFDHTHWLAAGPMITAEQGYPTQSWGSAGYGLEVAGASAAAAAVDTVLDAGATVIKVPLDHPPALTDDELTAVVTQAHARGAKVVAHALGEAGVERAAKAGVDVLAHTPIEALSDATVASWRGRAVITTLAAFGGADTTLDNLRRLRDAGAVVVYGTDLGNTLVVGVDEHELELLVEAGLSPTEILAAGTRTPAALWGMDDLGVLEPGRPATFMLVPGDPLDDPRVLSTPSDVFVDGVRETT